MCDYVAWVAAPNQAGGFASVAKGTLNSVRAKAEEILRSEAWTRRYGPRGVMFPGGASRMG